MRKLRFTLIELLVVISIIAILSSILLPSLSKARQTSRQTVCQSNLRQFGLAFNSYGQDYNGFYPAISELWPPGYLMDFQQTWCGKLWTYIGYKNEDYNSTNNSFTAKSLRSNVYQCPIMRAEKIGVTMAGGAAINQTYISYGLNSSPMGSSQWKKPVSSLVVKKPSSCALLNESSYYAADFDTYWNSSWGYGVVPHNLGENVLYFDGHVGYLKLNTIPRGSTNSFWTGI